MYSEKDFQIKTIGKPDILSPLEFSTTEGDGVVNFVEDSIRIPYLFRVTNDPEMQKLSFEYAGPRKTIYFQPEDVTAAIMTCGGLCPGLNNAIRSIVMQLHHKYNVRKIFGVQYGQKGLDPDFGYDPIELTPKVVTKIHEVGGSFLGTSRGKVPTEVMVDTMEKLGINILFCLGGDGTQKGLHDIHIEATKRNLKIACVGIPKTIDNDISFVYKTFGLDTAVTIAKEAVRSAHCEAESAYNGIGLVKVMGRHSGFIAALTALANNDVNYCLIPEIKFDLHGQGGFFDVLEKRLARRHHAVIVVSEGTGQEFFEHENDAHDPSGNVRLKDIGLYLKEKINNYFKEKNIPTDLKYIDPSYMIRSVPTNANDSIFAAELGRMAVDAAMTGKTDMLIGYWHGYFTHVPLLLAVSERKEIYPESEMWRDVLSATGQPLSMKNPC